MNMKHKTSKNIKTVLDILEDEIKGDVGAALKKMDDEYSMSWAYKTKKGKLFPSIKKNIKKEMKEVYKIEGRKYDIKNIAEGKDLVIVEMVESYPDSKTRKVYRTPLVIVLEMKNGKIKTGRHYCDPQISYAHLTKSQINKLYK